MKTLLLNLTITLTATASNLAFNLSALAEGGHFTLPPNAPAAAMNPVAQGFVNDMNPPSCQNKSELMAHFQNYRQKARVGYANTIVKMIPPIIPGTKCINAKEAFDARYEKNGDYFVLTCLAETKGKLTHLYKMELLVDTPICLNDTTIKNFVNSAECQRDAKAAMRFQTMVLGNCPMLQEGQMPKLRGSNAAYAIDPAYFARLLNDRPSIQNIVDSQNFKVKLGRTDPGGNDTGDNCNAGGCLPSFGKDAR